MALPRDVVREDHRLEKQSEASTVALAELRWHWTLDEDNPKRVPIREYARSVGRSESVIRRSAKACAVYTAHPGTTMADARVKADLSVNRVVAVEAVAEARGITLETAQHKRRNEVTRVLAIAEEKAEKNDTTIEEEAPAVAKFIVKAEKADTNAKAKRQNEVDLRLIEAEGKALKMIREGTKLLALIRDIEWDDEAVEILTDSIGKLRALVGLMDVALVGAADIDWDDELARLTKE